MDVVGAGTDGDVVGGGAGVIERVQSELHTAMRAGDRTRVDALRLMLSALQKAEKDGPAGAFTDADAEAVLRRERKQRLEAAEAYRAAGHADAPAKEEADVPVIDEFLPAAMDCGRAGRARRRRDRRDRRDVDARDGQGDGPRHAARPAAGSTARRPRRSCAARLGGVEPR